MMPGLVPGYLNYYNQTKQSLKEPKGIFFFSNIP